MGRFHLMSVFIAVAEAQSFAAAARKLALSPPAITRAVTALEENLGIKLFTRTTRYVRLTDAGLRYFGDARRILNELDEADEAAAGINAGPRGHLTVTAPVLFGKYYVMPGIVDYLNRYPHMQVSGIFLDRVVNLLEEGFDVGIRIGELPNSSLRAIRVGSIRRVVCASPAYLAENGAPAHPQELADHLIVSANAVTPQVEWKFADDLNVHFKPRLVISNNDAAIEAVKHDLGITRLLSYQVEPYLANGQLQIILSEFEPKPLPIHVIHLEGRFASAKVRAFVDLIVDKLRSNGALNQ
ncbi:MAG: LysR family transcriptional regulator [Methylococcaceae bacterium]|nr:LysR family transcriptional regulator [Methylococcaceae bacterium]